MTKKTKKGRLLVQGTLILSVAALLTKVLSAVYRVPFQNIVGDIGFYIYQQVYPFYGIAITLATYGFPVIISKVCADVVNSKNKQAENLLIPSFIGIFLLCFIFFLAINQNSSFIAMTMGDEKLEPMIAMVAYSYLLVPFISVLRGFFQGKSIMTPTAISQVGEQFIRVSFILITAVFLVNAGESLYRVGEGAIFSSIVGSLFAIIILMCFFIYHSKKELKSYFLINIKESFSIIKIVIFQGLAICDSSLTLLLFQMSDAFQILSILVKGDTTLEVAQQTKGVYDRGQPLLQLGLVLATSLSLAIVPMIASLKQNGQGIAVYIRISLQVSFSVSTAATIGLFLIMNEVNTMLFQNDAGSSVLRVLVVAIMFASMTTTISAILQGFGFIYYPAMMVLLGLVIKIALNQTFISTWGVTGAAWATNLSLFFILMCLIWKLRKVTKTSLFQPRFIIGFLKSISSMIIVVLIIQFFGQLVKEQFIEVRMYSSVIALITAIVGGLVFLTSLLRGGAFTEEEIALLPFSKLQRFAAKRKR